MQRGQSRYRLFDVHIQRHRTHYLPDISSRCECQQSRMHNKSNAMNNTNGDTLPCHHNKVSHRLAFSGCLSSSAPMQFDDDQFSYTRLVFITFRWFHFSPPSLSFGFYVFSWFADLGIFPVGRSIQTRILLWWRIADASIPWFNHQKLDAVHHWDYFTRRFGEYE